LDGVQKDLLSKLQNTINQKLLEELYKKYEKLLKNEVPAPKQEAKEREVPRLELSCEEVKSISGDVYYVIGRKWIDEVKRMEKKLKIPPIYFREGECREMLEEMGIKEDGIYLVRNGKLIGKIYRPT